MKHTFIRPKPKRSPVIIPLRSAAVFKFQERATPLHDKGSERLDGDLWQLVLLLRLAKKAGAAIAMALVEGDDEIAVFEVSFFSHDVRNQGLGLTNMTVFHGWE